LSIPFIFFLSNQATVLKNLVHSTVFPTNLLSHKVVKLAFREVFYFRIRLYSRCYFSSVAVVRPPSHRLFHRVVRVRFRRSEQLAPYVKPVFERFEREEVSSVGGGSSYLVRYSFVLDDLLRYRIRLVLDVSRVVMAYRRRHSRPSQVIRVSIVIRILSSRRSVVDEILRLLV